jgi:hypothetical protein
MSRGDEDEDEGGIDCGLLETCDTPFSFESVQSIDSLS